MSGSGTLIATAEGQGEDEANVSNTGGASEYQTGDNPIQNNTGGGIKEGDVLNLSWDSTGECVSADSIGERGSGTVSTNGSTIEVSSGGDTGLSGTVEIDTSGKYGNNSGYARAEVTFGNVNGMAAYLEEA